MFPRNPIPPAVVTAILDLWGNGERTSQIGRALGISKNAVVGKINRLRVNFGARGMKIDGVAEYIAEGGDVSDFDRDEPFGQFALAEMRRGLGRQAI